VEHGNRNDRGGVTLWPERAAVGRGGYKFVTKRRAFVRQPASGSHATLDAILHAAGATDESISGPPSAWQLAKVAFLFLVGNQWHVNGITAGQREFHRREHNERGEVDFRVVKRALRRRIGKQVTSELVARASV